MSEEQIIELTEQQRHLASLLQQKEQLVTEIETIKNTGVERRDLLLKVLGAIEYLTQVGVSLPESPEEEAVEEESTEG